MRERTRMAELYPLKMENPKLVLIISQKYKKLPCRRAKGMQDINKVEKIRYLLADLVSDNESYCDKDIGSYFDYDGVIALLNQVQQRIKETARCLRPADLPENMAWSEKFYDPEEKTSTRIHMTAV
jgi:hypothetical protein